MGISMVGRRYYCISLICLFPLFIYAQKPARVSALDSMLHVLAAAKDDTCKEKLLHAIAFKEMQRNTRAAMEHGIQELALAQKLNYKSGIAAAYYIIGSIYNIEGNASEASKNLLAALRRFQEINNLKGVASCYSSLGTLYAQQDNFSEALKNYLQALQIDEKNGANSEIASINNNIGALYLDQKAFVQARKYYEQALKATEKNDIKNYRGAILQNIAIVLESQGQFQAALDSARHALNISAGINNKYQVATSYQIIGGIYNNTRKFDSALSNCSLAAKMLEELGAEPPLVDAYQEIGSVYFRKKNYREAKRYFIKELRLAERTGAIGMIRNANDSLSEIYAILGDTGNALIAFKAFVAARDSVNSEERAKKAFYVQAQYDFDKKEAAAKAGQVKKDAIVKMKLQQKNMLISGICLLFILASVFGWGVFRHRRLKAAHALMKLEQKQLLAQINPHFIFNCLNSIQHFVLANNAIKANKYLSDFAVLMRQTLECSKLEFISVSKEIEYLKNYLSLEWMLFEDRFTYEITVDDNTDFNCEIPPMIIQPFVENAIRHGLCYLTGVSGRLKVHFYTRDSHLCCEIDDNGIGRDRSRQLKKVSAILFESEGIEMTKQRLALVSKRSRSEYDIKIMDKKDTQGEPAGTAVIIKFPSQA